MIVETSPFLHAAGNRSRIVTVAIALLCCGNVLAQEVCGWGEMGFWNITNLTNLRSVVAGPDCTFAIKQDGTLAAWGAGGAWSPFSLTTIPGDLGPVTAVRVGDTHVLALRSDGVLRAWGDNSKGQCSIPGNLGQIVDFSVGGAHSLVAQAVGPVRAWGSNDYGQSTVPSGLVEVVSVRC